MKSTFMWVFGSLFGFGVGAMSFNPHPTTASAYGLLLVILSVVLTVMRSVEDNL
jgi:hypothetical protein